MVTKTEIKPEEMEKLILELAQKGMTAEKIGLTLRDEHGWQKNKQKIKISEILKKNNAYIQPDLVNYQKKILTLRDHLKKNKKDIIAKRDIVRLESNLNKLKKYLAE